MQAINRIKPKHVLSEPKADAEVCSKRHGGSLHRGDEHSNQHSEGFIISNIDKICIDVRIDLFLSPSGNIATKRLRYDTAKANLESLPVDQKTSAPKGWMLSKKIVGMKPRSTFTYFTTDKIIVACYSNCRIFRDYTCG